MKTHLGLLERYVPYPIRAAKISIDLKFFSLWLVPEFTRKKNLTEESKRNGATQWWFRWLFIQISYSRWL